MPDTPAPMVNFMIVGAQKCGTTALWSYLAEHPDICMAEGREVHLFDLMDTDYVRPERLDRFYAGYFPHYRGQALRGESTPAYLYHPRALAQIHRYNPDMKLIVLLRDPIERALSHYAMERAQGHERWPLTAALMLESLRLWWHRRSGQPRIHQMFYAYTRRGRYRQQLRRLRQHFPASQVLILDSRALSGDHAATLKRVYAFLGVPCPQALPASRQRFVTDKKPQPGLMARGWLWLTLGAERRRYLRGDYTGPSARH